MSFARSVVLATVAATAALTLVACSDDSTAPVDDGADTVADTEIDTATDTATPTAPAPGSTPDSSPGGGQQPEGFTTVLARITDADGEVCEVCLWLADDAAERGRGLMGVTDLGDAVGMAFRFEDESTGAFYMFQTPTPLSIAWFASDGTHVGSADMDPCLDTPAGECPLYSPGRAYDLAIETFDGGLDPLGLGPGSLVELIEGSESERCPAAR